jgi:signal transduction histidine kinase
VAVTSQRKSIYFFVALGVCLVVLAVALNVGWILLNWREVALLVLGIVFFLVIIAGLVLNTIFLVREIRRNEQHDAFINAVTHELKTPIASIRLLLQTVDSRSVDDARRHEFYRMMLDDTDRLLQTVEQVLKAGRAGDRRRQLHLSVIDLGELVRESVQLNKTRANLADSVIEYSEALENGDRPLVSGDQDELLAAISNLIDNAIKYSDSDVNIKVEVSAFDSKYLRVRVSDQGIGIHREQLKRIFTRFYRVQRRVSSKVKGTGLGLYIVGAVARKHGGKVFAESEGEGQGSTFTLLLPRVNNQQSGRESDR